MMKNIFLLLLLLSSIAFAKEALLLYGGSNHKEFLGCLNCNEYDSKSICNDYGTYGSSYQSNSIWNDYGTYGSSYNSESPWNQYSSSAPAIVDRNGNFYGYFSTNQFHNQRTNIEFLVYFLDNFDKFPDLDDAKNWFCKEIN